MRIARVAVAAAAVLLPAAVAAADPIADAANALGDAAKASDAGAVKKLFAAKVVVDRFTFRDAKCNKAFGGGKKHTVTQKQHAKLAACLIGENWLAANTTTPYEQIVGYENYSDSLELQVTFSSGASPKVEQILAVQMEINGVEDGEADGVVGGVVGGDIPPPPPPPPAPPQVVAPTALEQNRLTGNSLITPDDDTKKDIARSGKDKIVASFKFCVDTAGTVTTVTKLKSSGFPGYDAKLAAGIKTWTYKPYLVNGKLVAVCTAATFIYSQH